MTARRGITMIELTVASVVGMIILIQLGTMQGNQMRLGQAVGSQSAGGFESMLAVTTILNRLAHADRIVLRSTGTATNPSAGNAKIQFRYVVNPTATATSGYFDIATNYRWAEYRFTGSGSKRIEFFDNVAIVGNCSSPAMSWTDIGMLIIEPDDGGPAPPGGEPALADNNMLRLMAQSANSYTWYHSQITLRDVSYTNLTSTCPAGGPCDSGVGLDVGGFSGGIPAVCP